MPYPYKSIREWFSDEEELGNVVRISTPIKRGNYSNLVHIDMHNHKIKPVTVAKEKAPCKQVIIPEDKIDLNSCKNRARQDIQQASLPKTRNCSRMNDQSFTRDLRRPSKKSIGWRLRGGANAH